MKIFKLPDLGEGLPDAVIQRWQVREGDKVAEDQTIVTVETAKALVEVPSPYAGTVEKLFAQQGQTLQTGQPLIGFSGSDEARPAPPSSSPSPLQAPAEEGSAEDAGTVVGRIDQQSESLPPEQRPLPNRPRNTTPAIRALARQLNVDLSAFHPAGSRFSEAEVRAAARGETLPKWHHAPAPLVDLEDSPNEGIGGGLENDIQDVPPPLPAQKADPARRAMALAMTRSRDQICPMTLCDEVDISAWPKGTSTTLRLLRATVQAVAAAPNLNAYFSDDQLQPQSAVNIGLALDARKGLFVPVLKGVVALTDEELLTLIVQFKQQADEGAIPQADLQGATIHLSNFGSLGGRFATPVVVPPLVCIVGAGRSHDVVLPVNGKARVRRLLPLSVSADHRAVTGGELARFLATLCVALSNPQAPSS